MSFSDCIQTAVDAGEAKKALGEKAQKDWRDRSDTYERQGHPRHVAEYLAAEDVKASLKREAGAKRHVYTAKMANIRKQMAEVAATKKPETDMTDTMTRLDYTVRGLTDRFNGRLGRVLKEHHPDLLGRLTSPEQYGDVLRELHGEATGNAVARDFSIAIRDALEDMRILANEAGAIIGKLDDWGLPHFHDRLLVSKAGFENWARDVQKAGIDWTRIEDHMTGKPFQAKDGQPPSEAIRTRFLREIYDNIAFGKESREAVYGRPKGTATYRQNAQPRVLTFKSADAWMNYNRRYGGGTPHAALMEHVSEMARNIALMRQFGPNPGLGAEYRAQLLAKRARDEGSEALAEKIAGNSKHALSMLRILSGPRAAGSVKKAMIARFFSTARHAMTSAFLDRAVFASVSDLNTMRLAASAMGINPVNLLSRHVKLMAGVGTDELLRAGHIANTLADPGAAFGRFQHEVQPAPWARVLSSTAMRIQGLSHWTDMGKMAMQWESAALFASQAGKALKDVDDPLRSLLVKHGITDTEWRHFTNPEHLFRSTDGATFADPMYWVEATDLPRKQAEEIFAKMQSFIEQRIERAVPTSDLWMRAFVEGDLEPGTILYEAAQSGKMFKSFIMTYTVNQIREISGRGGLLSAGGASYAANLLAGATVLGAVGLQIGDMLLGRDPQDMTDPQFWARAMLKGGGLGIVGDLASTGLTSWGGGFPTYIAGPVPQALGDVFKLTAGNAVEFAKGEKTNFAKELGRFGKRYTPMGQTPLIGPAMDRMIWDQMQLFLDPASVSALVQSTRQRQKNYGQGEWYPQASGTPQRLPNFANALGQ